MRWEKQVTAGLKDSGVDFVTYLPDSVLWPLIERVEADDWFDTHLVAREEEAVGVLAGAWLGGRKGALVCQTSGLANTFNALAGLSKPWGLPFVGIVSRRGNMGEHNLSQAPAGYAMPELLDTIGIRNQVLDESRDLDRCLSMASDTAFKTEDPYVLLLDNTLTGGKS